MLGWGSVRRFGAPGDAPSVSAWLLSPPSPWGEPDTDQQRLDVGLPGWTRRGGDAAVQGSHQVTLFPRFHPGDIRPLCPLCTTPFPTLQPGSEPPVPPPLKRSCPPPSATGHPGPSDLTWPTVPLVGSCPALALPREGARTIPNSASQPGYWGTSQAPGPHVQPPRSPRTPLSSPAPSSPRAHERGLSLPGQRCEKAPCKLSPPTS